MWIGVVVGNVVSTKKDDTLLGSKLLIVRPLYGGDPGRTGLTVAVDTVGAGPGERVLILQGSSARVIMGKKDCAVDAAIVGIIDTVEMSGDRHEGEAT